MSVKERIKIFVKYKNISIIDFEKSINVANGYVNSISKSIGIDKINIILDKYPNLNIEWLLSGRGNMLKITEGTNFITESEIIYNKRCGTPIYDIDAIYGKEIKNFKIEDIIGYIDIPSISKDSKIVFVVGDSMSPKILDGDRIVIREIENLNYYNYGQMYLVLTADYRMLKYVRKHPTNKNLIILHSENINYDDIELPKKDIIKLFLVENILTIKSL
ncbi:MAG: peptidase [Bacteroidetes bacterium]|nr:peptidase [Bacteroidota bacterium]